MVGIFVDHDLVAVPEPVIAVGKVEGGDAEGEAAKPKTVGTAAANPPNVAAAEAASEAAVLPGMIEVEAGIVATGVVPNPSAVVVDVRGFGMAFFVATGRGSGRRATNWGRTMFGNVSAADCVTASSMTGSVLRPGRDGENQRYSKNCGE